MVCAIAVQRRGIVIADSICTYVFGRAGTYRVVLDELHFRDLLMAHITPPPVAPSMATALMPVVCFPSRH